jgi:hypothetical protein
MSESFHDRILIIRHSIQKLAAHRRRPKNFLPAMRILVDILSERCQRFSLWVPEAAAYTQTR